MKSLVGALVLGQAIADEHPIGKVIKMLEGLEEKAKAEGQSEEVTFAKFSHWCKNSISTLDDAILNGKAMIMTLEDSTSAKTKSEETLTKQIAELSDEIGEMVKEQDGADQLRKKGNDLYTESDKDTASTIDAIKGAIEALSGAKGKVSSLAQQRVGTALALLSTKTSEMQQSVLRAYMEEKPDVKASGDKATHVKKYSFKSGNVVELLKQLLMDFEDQQLAATKAETNSQNAHDLSTDARQNAKKAAQKSKDEKTELLATTKSDLATAKENLQETSDDLKADSTALSDTKKQCALKASEYGDRTTTREGEIEAIKMAIKILAKVTGVRTEAPENPVPPPSPVNFLQLSNGDDPRDRAVQLLRQEATVTHSHALERLAQEISVHRKGPFQDVINMIQKMIFRLNAEQTDEDKHKAWCDQEIEKSNTTRDNKDEKVEDLTKKIEANTATVQVLTDDLADNEEMISTIVAHVKEATEIRQTGKSENAAAVKDAEEAQTAVSNAIAVLEQFYKESGAIEKEAYELVQRGVDLPKEPSTWGDSYTGVADPAKQPGGIVTVLKKVSEDFARMSADTEAQEATDQAAFDEDMKANAIEKARRTKESEMKQAEKKRLLDKTAALSKTQKEVNAELEAVNQYLKDLQPACVDGDSSYEERKANRAKEVEALKKAQGILAENAGAAFLAPVKRAM